MRDEQRSRRQLLELLLQVSLVGQAA
jgi:hypothetical protein